MTNDTVSALERLVAIDEIKRLKARFFLAVDGKDWATYATLFTDDARFEIGGAFGADGELEGALDQAAVAVGGTAMAALVSTALADTATAHIGHMPVIDLTGADTAQAIWPVEDWLWFAAGADPAFLHGFGHYDDLYVRTADGWRIARLRYTRTRFA